MVTSDKAIAAHRRGDLVEAERLYRELLHAAPSNPELQYGMGLLCHQTGRLSESMQWLQRAIALAPASIPTLQLLIRVQAETGNAEGALFSLERYLALRPDDAAMLNVKGQQLVRLGRLHEAERAFYQATERAGDAALYHDLGLCRQWLGDLPGAITAYQQALERGHDHPRTRLSLAQCLRATGKIREYYQIATGTSGTAPNDIELLIEAQAARRYVCDWESAEANQPSFMAGLRRVLEQDGGANIPPGLMNFMDVDETTIAEIARRYARQLAVAGGSLRLKLHKPPARNKPEKLRLGYLSTDFFAHAVGFLVRDLFACHDRARFEVYGYSLRHHPDEVQARIQEGCDVYRKLAGSDAGKIAQSIVNDQIDILIDLAGYTSAAQPVVLAARPAPVQISWLGYLGTSGADFIDYLIADDVALPPELAADYTERIMRLPHFMVTSPLPAAEQAPSREEAGLGGEGFVFCSFNQPYKLDWKTFGAWMEILRRVPGSRLWMYVPDPDVCGGNLRHEAARLDVDPERLVFAGREPMARHLARMSLADLALDPFHISGGATSVAALNAGVPILTLRGRSFLARMGSSINVRLGMADLDCQSAEQYVAKAVELATKPAALTAVKERLGMARQTHPFFNTRVFVRTLEEALRIAWERHETGHPPADVKVTDMPGRQ
jgi:predicted O-linked N-acetylglucosamine transferase (SPINDLY family)